jgi:hypothetical protein
MKQQRRGARAVALEDLDCEIQESFLAGYCWADPPEDLAVLLARQPNQRAFHHGLQLADVSRGRAAAASPEELADWSQALENTLQHTNATYGPIATVDEESGTVRLIVTSDTLDGTISDDAADGFALLRQNHPRIP